MEPTNGQSPKPCRISWGGCDLQGSICVEARPTSGSLAAADSRFIAVTDSLAALEAAVHLHVGETLGVLALERRSPRWVGPKVAQRIADIDVGDREIVFVLWKREDGSYGVAIPLASEHVQVFLRRDGAQLAVHLKGDVLRREEGHDSLFLYLAIGRDPFQLALTAAAQISLANGVCASSSTYGALTRYLGWCTWDAFYTEVDADGIIKGLESFRRVGVSPRLLIVDDGWQDVEGRRMRSMDADPRRFPGGLAPFAHIIKERHGIQVLCIWHVLIGYWEGISAKSKHWNTSDVVEPVDGSNVSWIAATDIEDFYDRWYRRLAVAGVDAVKVDGESLLADHAAGAEGATQLVAAYQRALAGATERHMRGEIIHCGAHSNEIVQRIARTCLWRNSDDFFPCVPDSHPGHIYANACNNLWSAGFAVPDWDMFQTSHPAGRFHAAARVLSGGPIYVSDRPGEHDAELLAALCTREGVSIRCTSPAWPTEDRLFVDCCNEPRLLKIWNRIGPVGLLGLFNCTTAELASRHTVVEDAFAPCDVPGFTESTYAVYLRATGRLLLASPTERVTVTLGRFGWEIAILAPVERGVALLGLVDKLNPPAAIVSVAWSGEREISAVLADGGTVGFYTARRPSAVLVDGARWEVAWSAETGLLTVVVDCAGEFKVALWFAA